jgi:CRISPR-associated protein Csd1
MLLEKLCEYAERLDLPPTMYVKTAIRWLIDLDVQGNFYGFVATEGGGGKKDRGRQFLAPHILRTSSAIRAKLLADNGEYVLGVARDKSKPAQVARCHADFVGLVQRCADITQEPTVKAVFQFLQGLQVDTLSLPADFDPTHILTFRVDGVMPITLSSVQHFWASSVSNVGEDNTEHAPKLMQCLICGDARYPVKRLPIKIKRIPRGQPAGMALISAENNAFESYGLENSLIAPTCQECGERFSNAANALIEDERTHITVGPVVYVFWTREEDTGFSVTSLLSTPEPDAVRALIRSAFSGHEAALGIDTTPFYATAFSASGARVVVRDWLDTTVTEVKRHLARYFALQNIVDRDGAEGKPFGLYALATSTLPSRMRDPNEVRRELPPNVPHALLHTALRGGPLPMGLLFQAVKRSRAEQRVTRSRAALIKMVLLSQQPFLSSEESIMVQLDTDNRNPAYLCGRLLAVLEAVQRAAIPSANTTITDRFFGAASTAPASVFGPLLRGARSHLSKLRKERRGTFEALERKLEEIHSGLATFPKILSLEQQGFFNLGYYHQRAADRAGAIAYRQAHGQSEEMSEAAELA